MSPGAVDLDGLEGWRLYGITTVDRPERSAHLEAELARTGLPWEVRRSERPTDPGGFLSSGVRGCFESHRAVLESALHAGVGVAVIVEDDAVIARRLVRRLGQIAAELDGHDWTMLYIGYVGDVSPICDDRLTLVTGHVAVAGGWEVLGAHCLAFRREVIPQVLENMDARLVPGGHRIPVDGVYNEYRRDSHESTLICVPNLAHQGPSPSGITHVGSWKNRLLRHALVRRVVEALKREAWNLEARLPPTLVVSVWNRRAARRRSRTVLETSTDG